MSRRWILGAGALIVALVVAATQLVGAGAMVEAKTLAGDGAWRDAIDLLDAPSALPPSAPAHQDLGALWYRAGELPRAIAHWRAARELSPRRGDVVHDLAVARGELEGAVPPPVGAARGWMDVVTPEEVGLLALLAWLGATAGAIRWRRRRTGAWEAVAVGVVGAALTGLYVQGHLARTGEPVAVVVEDTVARDGADLDAGARFDLAAGSELRTVQRRGPWLLVTTGDDRRGWVLDEVVVMPLPGRRAR